MLVKSSEKISIVFRKVFSLCFVRYINNNNKIKYRTKIKEEKKNENNKKKRKKIL